MRKREVVEMMVSEKKLGKMRRGARGEMRGWKLGKLGKIREWEVRKIKGRESR